ncbi:MAG: succinate dehydrogenase cytochrome b subunit [Bdellovibrionales bacterium]
MSGFFSSTVGKKYLMGLSGLVWAGFVFVHMAGNLTILISNDLYNQYGHAIVSNKPLLYATEAILIASLLLHVYLAFNLTLQNRKAKGIQPSAPTNGAKSVSLASRSMIIHGTILLFFIITHLITFKFGEYYETTVDGVVMRDLAKLMTEVFSQPAYVGWYIVSLILLGTHLSHGFGSVFQSFGLLHPAYQSKIKMASWGYAVVVTLGFLSNPIALFLNH